MNILQWSATIGVILSYYFMITRPMLCIFISIVSCSLMAAWALLLDPIAYGVLTLELFVIGMGLRNLWKLT